MHRREDCIFCNIVSGNTPSFKIHEDELTMTFLDVFPASEGHLLIITKEHFADIFSSTPEALAQVAANSVMIADVLKTVLNIDGLGVHQLNREAAGQTVFHYHMHLIPQTIGREAGIHSKKQGDPEQLKVLAEKLSAAVESYSQNKA